MRMQHDILPIDQPHNTQVMSVLFHAILGIIPIWHFLAMGNTPSAAAPQPATMDPGSRPGQAQDVLHACSGWAAGAVADAVCGDGCSAAGGSTGLFLHFNH